MDKLRGSSFVKMVEFSGGDFDDYSEIVAICYRDDYEEVLESGTTNVDTTRAAIFTSVEKEIFGVTYQPSIFKNEVFEHAANIVFAENITRRLLPGKYKMEISRKEIEGNQRTLKNKINLFHLDDSITK